MLTTFGSGLFGCEGIQLWDWTAQGITDGALAVTAN